MKNLEISSLQETIENEIQILFSELSDIKIDKIGFLIAFATLIISGYYSDLSEKFPGWVPISLLIIIILSINEISESYYQFESSQYPQESIQNIRNINDSEKRKILYFLDFKSKFSLIKPILVTLSIIIIFYFLFVFYYFLQLDLNLNENKTIVFILMILFGISEVILAKLIFPSQKLIDMYVKNQENPNWFKKIADYLVEKILKSGLKLPAYLTPILIIYLLFASQINQNLVDSLNTPIFLIFLIGQYIFWLILQDVFISDEVKNHLRRKIKWLRLLKNEVFMERTNSEINQNRSQFLIEKYQLTNLFSYEVFSKLFFFSRFSINYDIDLAIRSQNEMIKELLKK